MPDIFISTADAARDSEIVRLAVLRAGVTGESVIINATGAPSSGGGNLTFDEIMKDPARGIAAGHRDAVA